MNAHAMQQAAVLEHSTIQVQAIYPAKAANKSATIKDSDGQLFSVWPKDVGLYRIGETYEVEFTSTTKNGVTYRDLKRCQMVSKPQPAPAQFTSHHAPQPRSLSSGATPQQPSQQQSAPQQNGFYRPTSPRDAERMFVCSTLNAFIQTGRVDCHVEVLASYVNTLRDVWAATFGSDDQA